MDRDQRWDRIQTVLNAMAALPSSTQFECPTSYLEKAYEKDQGDEFVLPGCRVDYPGIQQDDGLLMVNFRADRVREILGALYFEQHDHLERPKTLPLSQSGYGMVDYAAELVPFLNPLFPRPTIKQTLGEVLSTHNLRQLRLAETEKFAHVTYFLNGGEEAIFPGEQRHLIPSPKVRTYDESPEMSALEITNHAIDTLHTDRADVILMNFANADMVGHTGNFEATIKACEFVDQCLTRLVDAVDQIGARLMVTADHGNADQMLDPETGAPKTAHSQNPVPFLVYQQGVVHDHTPVQGTLADIAPTVIASLNLEVPKAMTGKTLLS